MRVRIAVVLALVAAAWTAVSAQTNATGRWNMTISTDQGSIPTTLTLVQEGEALRGTITGNTLAWVIEVDAGGQFFEIAMEGTIDGDTSP